MDGLSPNARKIKTARAKDPLFDAKTSKRRRGTTQKATQPTKPNRTRLKTNDNKKKRNKTETSNGKKTIIITMAAPKKYVKIDGVMKLNPEYSMQGLSRGQEDF